MPDWIKIEKATADKPEVAIMAARLGIDPDAVLGKLFRVWSWFDSNTTNGVTSVTVIPLLDRRAGVTGFVAAMIEAGWAEVGEEATLFIPAFGRHMGKSAKTRAMTALRVAKARAETPADPKCNAASVTPPLRDALPKALPEIEIEIEELHTHTHRAGATVDEPSSPPLPRPGFPTKDAALAYCEAQGWPVKSGLAFWLHYDQARSNGDRAIGPLWHWWSALERWVINDAAGNVAPASAGRRTTATPARPSIDDYERADEWTPEQNAIMPARRGAETGPSLP